MVTKNLARVTIALDEDAFQLFEKLRREAGVSGSELVRRTLRLYNENKELFKVKKRIDLYNEMLSSGEHIILDIDHFILLLDLIGSSPKMEKFWQKSKAVAKSHAEQLSSKIRTPEDLLERLAACNFFRLIKNSEKEFTLVLSSVATRKFVKRLVEDFLESMEFDADVKEHLAKLTVKIT
jgi:negative regulator of replication initiation